MTKSEPTVGATLFMPGWPTRNRAYHAKVRKVERPFGPFSDPNDSRNIIVTIRWEPSRASWRWVTWLLGWTGVFDSRHLLEQFERESGKFVEPSELPELYREADLAYARLMETPE